MQRLNRIVGTPALALLAIAALALAALAPDARAQDLNEARETVATIAERGVSDVVAADLPQAEKIERFRDLFTTYFDIPSIGRFVLGRYWRAASPEEQDRFLDLFKEVNIYTWARRFGDYQGQELAVVDVAPDGELGALVMTQVAQAEGQPPITVNWRLREREDGYRVVDLIIEGASMAITYRNDYNSVIQQAGGDVSALNDRLETYVERLRAEVQD